MKKSFPTILALLVTAALFFMLFQPEQRADSSHETIIRVWLVNLEIEGSSFLRKQAAVWEKETGKRIYLRSATEKEAISALQEEDNVIPPDLIIGLETGEKIYAMGYALIVPDESAHFASPVPTSLLFFPPTSTPGPSPTPQPRPDFSMLSPILCPEKMKNLPSNYIPSKNPLQDLQKKAGRAALLTAGQARKLDTGYQADALENGLGAVFSLGLPLSEQGQHFLSFLQAQPAQSALREYGLYSPFFLLYGPEDPLRSMIDASIPR